MLLPFGNKLPNIQLTKYHLWKITPENELTKIAIGATADPYA